MYRIIFFLLSAIISSACIAQIQSPCIDPMPQLQFQHKMFLLSNASSEDQKLHVARNIAADNCLSSAQVKLIAAQFLDDFYLTLKHKL